MGHWKSVFHGHVIILAAFHGVVVVFSGLHQYCSFLVLGDLFPDLDL